VEWVGVIALILVFWNAIDIDLVKERVRKLENPKK